MKLITNDVEALEVQLIEVLVRLMVRAPDAPSRILDALAAVLQAGEEMVPPKHR